MNVKNLKKGMIVKNYKELCKILEVEVKNGGNLKKSQLDEFKKYFEWEKNGHSFIVTKVYKKPRAFTEDEMIELLLLHLIANNKNKDRYTIIETRKNMYEKLKMVNLNYKYCFNHPKEVAVYTNIPEDIVIARAGALSLAEIERMKIPAILIPLPSAAGNHQYYNAKALEKLGCTVIVEEKQFPDKPMVSHLNNMIQNPEKLSFNG